MTGPAIGDLRHRMTLQRGERAPDGGGGATVTWTAIADLWASLAAVSGGENFDSDRLAGSALYEIWMRHRPDAKPEMRFLFGSRVFDIRAAVDPDGRRRWTKCLVEEKDL